MKEPYCADCGVVQDLHSSIYCGILKQEREKYERKLEMVREMNRILRRDIDSLEDQGGIIDSLTAERNDIAGRLKNATTELEGIYGLLNGETPSQTPQEPAIDQIRKLKTNYRELFYNWEIMVFKQPVAERISELCEKVTLRDVQIADLTVERDSYKSMYQSSQDINVGLAKEHNGLKAAYEKLACSQPTSAEHLTDQMSKLITSMNEAGAAAVRPAPGRLEIAAMVLAGLALDSSLTLTREECAEEAVSLAIELLKADREADQA